MLKTNEGGDQYEFSMDHALEFFSKCGSLFSKRGSFYENEESPISLFQKVWVVDKVNAFKLLLWLRDRKDGAGNRSAFRSILSWLAENDGKWIVENIDWIPEIGRWDDLRSLFNTPIENLVSKYWADAISKNNVLAAKWANRKDKPVKHALGIKEEGKFRKLLANIRKNHIVEHKMCTKRFNEIDYKTVPSIAMSRYTNAFLKRDEERFDNFKEKLKSGEEKVHASVLFPHDCIRTAKNGDKEMADAQFQELPNYLEGTNEKIIVISDTSGSMRIPVSGSIQAVDIAQGVALYCSSKISSDNPFYKKFIGFCNEGNFKNWNGLEFSQTINDRGIFDGAIGPTRIDVALDSILETALFWNLKQDQMPTTLLIISDMQFHNGAYQHGTEVNKAMDKWIDAGYLVPKIVYWNTAGYAGSPEKVDTKNVALVSGFSPSILKAIFSGEDMTPLGVMKKALEKYEINIPKK